MSTGIEETCNSHSSSKMCKRLKSIHRTYGPWTVWQCQSRPPQVSKSCNVTRETLQGTELSSYFLKYWNFVVSMYKSHALCLQKVVTSARKGRGDCHSNVVDLISFLKGEYELQLFLCISHTCKQHTASPLGLHSHCNLHLPLRKKVMKNKSSKMLNQAQYFSIQITSGCCSWMIKKCLIPLWFGTFYQIFFVNKKFTRLVNAGHMFTLCICHKKQVWCPEKRSLDDNRHKDLSAGWDLCGPSLQDSSCEQHIS